MDIWKHLGACGRRSALALTGLRRRLLVGFLCARLLPLWRQLVSAALTGGCSNAAAASSGGPFVCTGGHHSASRAAVAAHTMACAWGAGCTGGAGCAALSSWPALREAVRVSSRWMICNKQDKARNGEVRAWTKLNE